MRVASSSSRITAAEAFFGDNPTLTVLAAMATFFLALRVFTTLSHVILTYRRRYQLMCIISDLLRGHGSTKVAVRGMCASMHVGCGCRG